MISSKKIIWLGACSIAFFLGMHAQLLAQSMDRKVFSNGGGTGTVNLQNIAYTFGEPMIGTDMTGDPVLTKGFHQPENTVALNSEDIALAVELQNEHALLNWTFEGYPPAAMFEVLRSEDGENYLTIGLKAVADTTTTASYQFIDPNVVYAPVNQYIYRVRAIREDGSFAFSNPVEINWSSHVSTQIRIFPNPARDHLNIHIPAEQGSMLEITALNALGQEVLHQTRLAEQLVTQIRIELGHLPRGVYVLRVMVNGGVTPLSFQLNH